ncbi:MAG: hypothetical protein AAF843_09475 [Bacteroidota bacterium]
MSYALVLSDNALEDIEKHTNSGERSVLRKPYSLPNELREHSPLIQVNRKN